MLLHRFMNDPGVEKFPGFDELVETELDFIRGKAGGFATLSGTRGCGYVQHSIYLPFLKHLLSRTPRSNVMFVKAENFFDDPVSTAKDVYRFLGLPDYEPVRTPVKNAGPQGTISPATEQRLAEFFAPLNKSLFEFIGSDFEWT
jgi:hypothetical protein